MPAKETLVRSGSARSSSLPEACPSAAWNATNESGDEITELLGRGREATGGGVGGGCGVRGSATRRLDPSLPGPEGSRTACAARDLRPPKQPETAGPRARRRGL